MKGRHDKKIEKNSAKKNISLSSPYYKKIHKCNTQKPSTTNTTVPAFFHILPDVTIRQSATAKKETKVTPDVSAFHSFIHSLKSSNRVDHTYLFQRYLQWIVVPRHQSKRKTLLSSFLWSEEIGYAAEEKMIFPIIEM